MNYFNPPEYSEGEERGPVTYHIHGWQGNESSEIGSLEKAYRSRNNINVFKNAISLKSGYFDALLQIEAILLKELIPYIEGQYRINATRENRMLSGFSMVGGRCKGILL